MNNKKGFTLIELLAVIVILGLLMAIAIPSVTKYITKSRKNTLVTTIEGYVTSVRQDVNEGNYKFSDGKNIYAIPLECVDLEKGGNDPFGEWHQANDDYWGYVLVQFDNEKSNYIYGFTFKDEAGYGLYPTNIANIKGDSEQVKTGYNDLKKPKTGLAIGFVAEEKWDGFKLKSTTALIVLESESDGKQGDSERTCTLENKGTNYEEIEASKPIRPNGGVANIDRNITLINRPFYNDASNVEFVTINGNGYTVTQKVTDPNVLGWNDTGNIANMGVVFSSQNGSPITVNDLTMKGTAQTISLGHYTTSTYNNYNTTFNNVNIIGLEVLSFSANIAPAVIVYGNATFNNTNIYDTKMSPFDNYGFTVYDLALVNYTSTTINGGKVGTIYTWAKVFLEINNATIDTITTQARQVSDFQKGELIIGPGTTVNKIIVKNKNAKITIKSGATVNTIDYTNLARTNMAIKIESGATVKNQIN